MAMMAPITKALLERAAVAPGERVVDVGCGCGSTTLELVRRGALAFGIDVSEPMLALAKERATGLKGVAFRRTDAATQPFTPDHELVLSRFGVMFFAHPIDAFRNLRTGITPGGRLCFVCWQAASENAWMSTAGQAVAPFLPKPAAPPDPRAPGPFAFADPSYLRSVLEQAGFASIEIEDLRVTLHLGDDLEQAMAFQTDVGPVARALAELEGEAASTGPRRCARGAREAPDPARDRPRRRLLARDGAAGAERIGELIRGWIQAWKSRRSSSPAAVPAPLIRSAVCGRSRAGSPSTGRRS